MNSTKGFTLIELLVVIAIIGILSGITLTALKNSRSGAIDSKVKQELLQLRSRAELFSLSHANNYVPNGGATVFRCRFIASPLGVSFVDVASGTCSGAPIANSLINDTEFVKIATDLVKNSGTNLFLGVQSGKWAMAVKLKKGFWCIDGRGVSREKNASGVPYDASITGGTAVAPALNNNNTMTACN